MDQILSAKGDIQDIEKIISAMEQKADYNTLDNFKKLLDNKVEKHEFLTVKQDISSKAERADIDMYVLAVQN